MYIDEFMYQLRTFRTKFTMNILLLILLTTWGATNSPSSSILQLETFTTYIESHYENWDNDEWDKASDSYSIIKKDLRQHEFTDEQLQEIGRYQGRCAVVFTKHYVDKAESTTKKTIEKIGGFLDGIGEALSN